MGNQREYLVPDAYFHLYNHANAEDLLFLKENDYSFFLGNYFEYCKPLMDTFCYSLLPNHFHLLVKIRNEEDIITRFGINLEGDDLSRFIANQIGIFFNSYAKHYNKKYSRRGSLFINTFNRKRVTNLEYLNILVGYIHANPVRAGLCGNLEDWKYSSYNEIVNNISYFKHLKVEELLSWFDGLENFVYVQNNFLNQP